MNQKMMKMGGVSCREQRPARSRRPSSTSWHRSSSSSRRPSWCRSSAVGHACCTLTPFGGQRMIPPPHRHRRTPPPLALAPQTAPATHPRGTGAALKGTRSRARASGCSMRGSSAFQPAAHDPSGFQAHHPLKLSPVGREHVLRASGRVAGGVARPSQALARLLEAVGGGPAPGGRMRLIGA